jgi:pimeloyl-ACP methyl ester carboxylesterase
MRTPTLIPSTEGVRIAVHDLGGPGDAGATVLLFSHATGFHGRVWEPVAALLADRYRCLALDYRGHGLSDLPDGAGLDWSRMGDDAEAVLESDLIGPNCAVHGIAHSMGGAALVLAAARHPGRFRSLWLYEPVIVPPGVLPPVGAPNPMAEAAARRRASFASVAEAVANYAAKPPLNQLHPDALSVYVRGGFAPTVDGRITLRCTPATEAAVFEGAGESGAWDALPALDLPVAIAVGRSEEYGPVAFASPALAHLRRGTLIERRGLGHFGPLEDPSGTARDITEWVISASG